MKTFDWVPRFDERSKDFRVAAVHGEVRNCDWSHGEILDQGNVGACVGYAATGNLMSTKRPMHMADPGAVALAIYHFAQTVDEFDGENYEGTSVLAGMKALKHNGYISRYEWAFSLQDILWALSWRGPVQLGVNWYANMMEPDNDGYIHVSGRAVGGHSILVSGVDPDREYVTLTNSWGASWGDRGQCKLTFNDLDLLMKQNGEAVSISKNKPTAAPAS